MVNESVAYTLQDDLFQNVEIADSPIKHCAVALSDVIKNGKRLDAQKYDVELRKYQNLIANHKYGTKHITGGDKGLCTSYRPGICKRIFVNRSDCSEGMLTPSQVTDINPKAEKFVSEEFAKKRSDWFVKQGEILLTCSGTVGCISFVSKTLNNKFVSQNLIRIVPKNETDTGYVYAYLKSSPGQMFLTRSNYGAVIKHIDPEHLATVPIPDVPDAIKKRIHELIIRSYDLRDESNDLIDEATGLLTKELKLPGIEAFNVNLYRKNANVDTFNVKLSDMAGRVDASYHVPIVDAIVNHMKKYAAEVTTVGDKRISKEIILPGRFKRVYVEDGYGRVFIGGKQLFELDPTNKKYLSLVHHGNRIAKQLELHEGMTLITCSGTIGKVALVGKRWENWTANQHIIRVVPATKDIAGYISIFLASEYGYPLITRFTYGSVVDEIDDIHVGSIPFPLLKNAEVQKRINELALKASEKRDEAYKMEQKALKIVDNEVIFAK